MIAEEKRQKNKKQMIKRKNNYLDIKHSKMVNANVVQKYIHTIFCFNFNK